MSATLPETEKNLVPLAEITTRQEAMSRCIGPLVTLATFVAIEYTEQHRGQLSSIVATDTQLDDPDMQNYPLL
jgi:hypothetical protein